MGSRSCSVPKLIIEELNQTDEVVDSAKRACQQLSAAAGPSSHNVCTSWLEAFATIQKREDDRRKSSKQEAKSKQKKTSNEQMQFRGTRIGVDPEVSAFWMVMEDYCRPVQPGDLQLLLPQHESLVEDTAFFMPPLGFNPTQDEAPETDDGHDAATPSDPAQDPASVPTGSVTLKADPVDSTMHEVTGGSAHEPAWEQQNNGPTILHGAPAASMGNLLHLMGSLFPAAEGDDSWQQLADAAAKEEGTVLEPQLVERIRSCIAKLQTSDAGASSSKPGSAALQEYMHVLSCADKNSVDLGSVSDADSVRATVQSMLQACVNASAERAMAFLPQIDAASALAGADQVVGLDLDAVAAPEQHTETVAPDEVIHPYLQGHLQNVVLVDPALQQGRMSPSLAAAPGTPVADHPDAEQPPAVAPPRPSTPATNGIDPSSECVHPPQDGGTETEAGQENAVECGNDAQGGPQPSQPGTREASVDCSSMAYSMDCSADVKEAPMGTPGPPESSAAPQTAQHQRRSSRKRNRQERDGDGNSGAKPPGKRAGTPHGTTSVRDSALSRHSSGKAAEVREMPREATPALAEREPSARLKAGNTQGGRAKGGAKAESAKASKGAAVPAESCDSEGALEQVKAEPKTSVAVPVAEKESSAPNGAAAGAAAQGDQEHDSTVVACSAEEQWVTLNGALDVLAIAPDDEVVAEIISLQAELLQVAAANRKRCSTVLKAVLSDLPAQAEKQAKQAKSEEEMEAFLFHVRALKRQAKLEKREAERKEAAEALVTAEAGGTVAIGGVAAAAVPGRARRTAAQHANVAHASDEEDDDDDSEDEVGGVPLPLAGASLVDPYALEVPDAINALCAVCGDGESKGADQIVFCDRCNVAVHQNCYAVGEIPQGDWLCWPCRMYEDKLKGEGKSRDDIRPPRFKESGNPDYPAGSKTIVCELCPMKRGIFKQAAVEGADGEKRWAHVVCALWQTPDVQVAHVNRVDVITGLDSIRAENACMTCAYCRQRTGATVKCAHTKCHTTFHPLCARRVGCFALCHHSTGRGRPTYKTWCAQHSDAAKRREKDAPTKSAPVNGEKRATGGPKQPQAAPEVTVTKEDLAEMEARLKSKNEALAFLHGVRYDLEAARMLAAQVEKREKGKMHVVDLLKQEYEMVLASPVDFVPYETHLGCRRHHHDLVNLMQSTFEAKRQKARRQFVQTQEAHRQQLYLQQQQQHAQQQQEQQQQVHQQQMHQVEPMPGMRAAAPGMPGGTGQMMYGQHRAHSGAPVRGMHMGGQVQGQAERMSQPQQYGMQHGGGMMGTHGGGFGGGMMPGAEGDSLLRGLGGYEQASNSPLVSPSSMLDPVSAQGAHMMSRPPDGRYSQSQLMQGVNRMPMDRSGGGSVAGGPGMGQGWQHAAHPHGGYNPHDMPSDHGMRSMRTAGGAGQNMMPMNANSFGLRAGEMQQHQHPSPDHSLGRMPLPGGDRGMGSMRDPTMMPGGSHLDGMLHMGNGQQYRVHQMRPSDPAAFAAQPRQPDGMAYMQQHPQDPGIQQQQQQQQQQQGFGAAPNANAETTRPGGRTQRAAAQAARGRSFANAADPFTYMDD